MHTKRIISAIAFGLLALIISLLAQRGNSTEQPEETQAVAGPEAIGIVGRRVSNGSGDSLGVVVNVVIAPTSGQVTALVVGIGGVFGYGSYNYEVPWQRVQFTDEAEVRLDVSRDKVTSVFPAYKPDSLSSSKEPAEGSEANERAHPPEDSGSRDESTGTQE